MDREQAGHPRASFVFMAHEMPRPLRRHHENIYVFRALMNP